MCSRSIDRDRDWSSVLPTVLGPFEAAGTFAGATVGPGTGDNMAAALGVGLTTGDAVVSAGTSGTAYAVCATPTVDPSGAVAGFADATGQFLPLVCTLNAAKVIDAVARLLGVDHDEFDRLALAGRPAPRRRSCCRTSTVSGRPTDPARRACSPGSAPT